MAEDLNGVPRVPETRPYGAPSAHGGRAYVPGYGQPPPGMRAATADRERAMDVLKAAYGEGRLTKDEFDERSGQVMASRTYGELGALVADLPAGPYSPQQVAPPPYYQRYQPVSETTNGMAIGSLILSLVAFSLPAVILGHISRGQIRRTRQRGDGMAIAGLVIGYLGMALWTLIILAAVVSTAVSTAHGHAHPGP